MITVIIAAKDADKWLQKTIDSLVSQSFKDWECIVSVNGSSDSTESLAKSINDSRFKTIVSEIPNKSLAVNRAILESSRDWICILDADDLWTTNKLSDQVAYLKIHNVDIVGTQLSYINERDELIPNAPILPSSHDSCVDWLHTRKNPIANSSVMYKKSLHDIVGYYDPEKFAVEDYDMWMRSMRANLTFANLDKKHLLHRIHKDSNYNSTTKQKICKILVDEVHSFMVNSKEAYR
jgi:glycosyltransferase involved in cell wall biosynthesis